MKNTETQQTNPDLPAAAKNEQRMLPLWLFRIFAALAFDIVATLILVFATLHFAGIWYNSHHAIPDPVEREGDLGTVLFGATLAYYVFFISFPVLFVLFYKSIRKYLKEN